MTFGVIAGTIGIVLAVVAIGALLDRWIGILPRPEKLREGNVKIRVSRNKDVQRPVPVPGDTAATALRAHGDRLDKLRTTQRCPTCREPLVARDDERVRFGGGELLLLHLACARCGHVRAMYIDDAAPK